MTMNNQTQQQAGISKNIANKSIIFISWKSSNALIFKKGVWYKYRNVKLNEYNGKIQIIIDSNSEVVEIYR